MSKKSNKFEQDQEKQINQLDEGLMSRLMRKILTKRFAKAVKIAYKDPTVRAAYEEWEKSSEDLFQTLKGTSKSQRHIRSDKFKKAIKTPGRKRSIAVTKALKDMGFDL